MSPAGSSHTSPRSSQRENRPLERREEVEDDKQSAISQASGIPRTEQTLDALRLVTGKRVRHARCAPEFLEEIAVRDTHIYLKKAASKKFKVLINSEARSFYTTYINNYSKTEANSVRNDNDNVTNAMPSPIVFAVTVYEGEFKCVDYYMTWRGQPKARQGKEHERQVEILDSGFRRLARALDDDYRRISSLRKHDNLSPLHPKFDRQSRSTAPPTKSRPSGIALSAAEEEPQKVDELTPALPEPPVSATDSVMSLPLLNMVRGVPLSHRVPLRVTNPDRLSVISDIDVTAIEPEKLAKAMAVTFEQASNAVPAIRRVPDQYTNERLKRSSASVRSSDTQSSKSSRSSRSSSRSKNRSGRHSSLGGRRDSSRQPEDRPSPDEELPEFLIVFLGDKLDRDTNSWHGLERQTSVRSLPPDRHSPWMGPLARADSIGYRHSPTDTPQDSKDSENDRQGAPPVIPMKPMMEAMGLIQTQYYRSPPVVPGGKYISIGSIGSPQSNQSPYLYSSPRMDASSPYVAPWMGQMPLPPSAPSSRPPSRAYSAASFASSYMQSHAGPF
ncbi:hypothetical protein NLJ89_g7750 [Agrocybe chaxingu]|uniref:Uncharacterized protein n=1 Tax=Agrocybe chaxingu TaxID=84603 RepID=A0A9W8K316_9AGAR|nr:hypothetical protein NLJ89_g7750 [Agrocybe chaxingu]